MLNFMSLMGRLLGFNVLTVLNQCMSIFKTIFVIIQYLFDPFLEYRIFVSEDDISFWEKNNISAAVSIDSMRDVLRVFVNGQLTGDGS